MAPQDVLLIGDWIFDENWLTTVYRSRTSSRTGGSHDRIIGKRKALCGAGQLATLLAEATVDGNQQFGDIHAVGAWATEGFSIAEELNKLTEQEPFAQENCQNLAVNGFETITAVRIYQRGRDDQIELVQRIDHERPSGTSTRYLFEDEKHEQLDELRKFIRARETSLAAVIIKDNRKGVVCPAVVKTVVESLKDNASLPWFISTKSWRPTWYRELDAINNIKILMIHPAAADTGLWNRGFTRWLTEGRPTREALQQIGLDTLPAAGSADEDHTARKEAGSFPPVDLLVVLPDKSSVLARDANGTLYVHPADASVPTRTGVPMTSIIFSALMARTCAPGTEPVASVLERSLDFTARWMTDQTRRMFDDEKPKPPKLKGEPAGSSPQSTWHSMTLSDAQREWEEALSWKSIIDANSLELWRAMVEIPGYVCCVDSKRQVLRKLLQTFSLQEQPRLSQNRSITLSARPGSGKSFLVDRLSTELGFRFLYFNVSQMVRRDDLLDCFDTIVTSQARYRGEPLLVFFDEINVPVETQETYGMFLAPLQDNVYVRGGKTFHMESCGWIFAGTEDPGGQSKGSDFLSRMTVPRPLDLMEISAKDSDGKVNIDLAKEQAKIENVYLVATLIRERYPDVNRISRNILRIAYELPPGVEVRPVKQFVNGFRNVQYGQLWRRNVPPEAFDAFAFNPQGTKKDEKASKSWELRRRDWQNEYRDPEGAEHLIRVRRKPLST